ncbi:ATP-binding protein [Cellulomonas sp. URHD0024]|uniref:AAA family ATPase n=1 Tax=Cellulomonas sp. URHD0024 TaxID=1302620 RepID=UPI00054E8658|nr:ATP-binding protein [Cellulomonas sp. URHD0024]
MVTPWERYADLVLQREAALCRVVSGVPPRDFAGMYVADEELDALLRGLPGLDGPEAEAVAPIRRAFAPVVALARKQLAAWAMRSNDPLARIARNADLTRGDLEVLALLTAVEVDPRRQRLVAYVQDSVQLPRLTHASLARLLGPDHPGARAVAPGSPLRTAELVVADAPAPWAVQMWGVAARVVWSVLGADSPDPGLPPRARLLPGAGKPPRSARAGPRAVLVHGADPESRRRAVAAELPGIPLLVSAVPSDDVQWSAVVREAVVNGAAVVLEVTAPPDAAAAARIEAVPTVSVALSSRRELPLESLPERRWRELDVLDGEAGPQDWLAATGSLDDDGQRLTREQLRLLTTIAGPDAVHSTVRRLAGGHLDGLALRVRPRRGWGDLVLPDPQQGQLHELAARYRQRRTVFGDWGFPAVPSAGVVALFAGPSGTGKTLAAEVVAGELGLDVYKVDLSAVVSKYIGETEKNLERIFAAAGAGDVVLFFDEADALFGRRSEVSSAHDRYANIEVAYLLQRLETFDGLVVMATNLQRNIDDAFLRRIGVAVTFTAPDDEQRRRIWGLVFPPEAPVEDLDLDFLARQFKVTGGVIRGAALGAAFTAADEGGAITMERVVMAMQREFVKLGHLSTPVEFERYFDVVRSGR